MLAVVLFNIQWTSNRLDDPIALNVPPLMCSCQPFVRRRSPPSPRAGFKHGLRWVDIQTHFSSLGLGKPSVVLIRQPPGGAYVLMPSQKDAARAIQVLRKDSKGAWANLRVMTYAQYWSSKRSRGKQMFDGSDASSMLPEGVASSWSPETGKAAAVVTAAAPADTPADQALKRVQSSLAPPPMRPALQRPASRPSSTCS